MRLDRASKSLTVPVGYVAGQVAGNWLRIVQKPVAYSVGGITMLWTLEQITAFWI
jgi:hypothetical protein